jgi:hypothetical protein
MTRSARERAEEPMPHKPGFIERELRLVASDYLNHGRQDYFNMLVAEALLMLLTAQRKKRKGQG